MNIYKFFVRSLIKKLSYSFNGDLTLIFPDKSEYRLGKNKSNYFLKIKSNHFFFRLLFYGVSSIGYSYYKGEWTTNNLSYVIKLGIENIKTIKDFKLRQKILENIIKMFSFSESNTVSKSKKQISYHYDLGDNFYKCWLDKTMTYSSAIFENKDISLERAQLNKYHSLAKLADIKKDNSILEIGCGWGGFTNYISKNIGSNITGITISKNQYNYVKKLRQKNVNIKFLDYRKITNVYDRIISIEMFEAVGKKNWNTFFEILSRSLREKGSAALQIITINENLYNNYMRNKDFIQKYIFPGGMLPTKKIIYNLARSNNLQVCEEKALGKDYAKTLKIWRENFFNKWNKVQKMGFQPDFKRLWEYYLTYCEEGFRAGTINVYQFLLKKNK